MRKDEESLWELWHTIKRNNLQINCVAEEKRKRMKEAESLFKELMSENFPNLVKFFNKVLLLESIYRIGTPQMVA